MKVVVKDFLNVRVGNPSVNAPCYQYLAPGSEIEIDGNLYDGDKFEGIAKWLKDSAGNYYWAGGTNKIDENLPWYITDFGIDSVWKKCKGEGVTIILIDSGVRNDYECLKEADITKDTIFPHDDGTDDFGHGTYMASIIAGTYPFYGIAKKAKIHSIKIQNGKEDSDIQNNLLKGLDKALTIISKGNTNNCYIVNLSLAFRTDSNKTFIDKLVQKIYTINKSDNTIGTASIGNQGKNLTTITIPASLPDVYSCAGVVKYNGDNKLQLLGSGTIYWETISIAAPAEFDNCNLVQFFNNNGISITDIKQGTSQACAYTSGVFALLMSCFLKTGTSIDRNNAKSILNAVLKSEILESKKFNVLNKETFIKQFNNFPT
ncbi:MAG: S8 family serine peptidase [Cytophagales bacterium]|nr:S8 family serine peptidase [Cytophagales bacterium]